MENIAINLGDPDYRKYALTDRSLRQCVAIVAMINDQAIESERLPSALEIAAMLAAIQDSFNMVFPGMFMGISLMGLAGNILAELPGKVREMIKDGNKDAMYSGKEFLEKIVSSEKPVEVSIEEVKRRMPQDDLPRL